MTNAIQIKLLAAILAVLLIIAGVLVRGSRRENKVIRPDPALTERFNQYVAPRKKPYIVP